MTRRVYVYNQTPIKDFDSFRKRTVQALSHPEQRPILPFQKDRRSHGTEGRLQRFPDVERGRDIDKRHPRILHQGF